MGNDLVIGVRRSLAGLHAIVSRFDVECEERVVPLSEIDARSFPMGESLLNSWMAVRNADFTHETTLKHALNILENTIPADEQAEPLMCIRSMLCDERIPIATAAHPRAYKGTKRKVPRQASTATCLDLRPHLMNPRSTREVLDYFDSRRIDNGSSARSSVLASVQSSSLNLNESKSRDPYLLAHHADSQLSSIYKLPIKFRQSLLPLLKGTKWSIVAGFLKLYWELNLPEEQRLLAGACRYLKLRGSNDALAMMAEILLLPSDCRADLLKVFIEMEHSGRSGAPLESGWLLRIFARSLPGSFLENVTFALQCRSQRIPLEYIEIAIDLHREFQPRMSPGPHGLRARLDMNEPRLAAGKFPVKELHDCLRRQLELDPDHEMFLERPWWGLGILFWIQFAERPELAEVFRAIPWSKLHPAVAQAYALLLVHVTIAYCFDDPEIDKWIDILTEHHARITDTVLRLPEPRRQKSFLCDIDRLPDGMKELLPAVFPEFLDILERVSVPPFSSKSYISTLLYAMLAKLPEEYRDKISHLSDLELMRLSRSCLRYNETLLASAGVAALADCAPQIVTSAAVSFHGKLLKVGKLLGCLNRRLRSEILLEFKSHALVKMELRTSSRAELLANLGLIFSSGCVEQFPRKLRRYLLGEIDLTPVQLAKCMNLAASKLDLIKLAFLERLCYLRMAPSIEVDKIDGSVRHALQMLQFNSGDENVRAFRKFLFRYLDGETDYLIKHPTNVRWLESCKNLNMKPWLEGFERCYPTAEGREQLRLKIETDPLEELKLGSHVGTCTGLGGSFSVAALGIVLDLNKRVVYATNSNGKVIGRQCIAITRERKLFCQQIYPRSALVRWERQFADFARALAGEVGIEIYTGDDSSVEIVDNLVAEYAYDDNRIQTHSPNSGFQLDAVRIDDRPSSTHHRLDLLR